MRVLLKGKKVGADTNKKMRRKQKASEAFTSREAQAICGLESFTLSYQESKISERRAWMGQEKNAGLWGRVNIKGYSDRTGEGDAWTSGSQEGRTSPGGELSARPKKDLGISAEGRKARGGQRRESAQNKRFANLNETS